MIQIDQQRGCEYMTVLLEKKETRAIARGAQSLCTRF
jgi:hypothetical protein